MVIPVYLEGTIYLVLILFVQYLQLLFKWPTYLELLDVPITGIKVSRIVVACGWTFHRLVFL